MDYSQFNEFKDIHLIREKRETAPSVAPQTVNNVTIAVPTVATVDEKNKNDTQNATAVAPTISIPIITTGPINNVTNDTNTQSGNNSSPTYSTNPTLNVTKVNPPLLGVNGTGQRKDIASSTTKPIIVSEPVIIDDDNKTVNIDEVINSIDVPTENDTNRENELANKHHFNVTTKDVI